MMAITTFDDIHEFLEAADLEDIVVHEERARRIVWQESVDAGELPEPKVSLGISVSGNVLRYRFRMVLADDQAEYTADFESAYAVGGVTEVAISDELQQEFARRVAFMAVYPFLRASIFGGASRLGTPRPVLGLVRQGDFEAGDALTSAEVRTTFLDNRSELGEASQNAPHA